MPSMGYHERYGRWPSASTCVHEAVMAPVGSIELQHAMFDYNFVGQWNGCWRLCRATTARLESHATPGVCGCVYSACDRGFLDCRLVTSLTDRSLTRSSVEPSRLTSLGPYCEGLLDTLLLVSVTLSNACSIRIRFCLGRSAYWHAKL
jgi:hypothetical protein